MSEAETFEEAPNMVPGEVETATEVGAGSKGGFQAGKLLFALAMLAFAGGWGYSNQDDFKAALGFKERVMPGCQSGGSCCAHATAMAEDGEAGVCCHEAGLAEAEAEAEAGSCCAQSQKSALVEALLKGTEDSEASTEEVEQAEVVIEELPVTTETEAAVEEEPAEEVAPVEAAPAA